MKTIIVALFLFFSVNFVHAQEKWVYHSHNAVTKHIIKHDLTVKAIYVKQIHVYGEGPKTLLIWKCGEQEMYHYSFPLTTQDLFQIRRNLMNSRMQGRFPIYLEE